MPSTKLPSVSVVVVPFNSQGSITGVLRQLEALDYADLELVVVDNFSSDGTWEEVERWSRQAAGNHAVMKGDPGHCLAKAVNQAVARCHGELVAVLNDDVLIVDPSWLRLLVDAMVANPRIAAAGPTLLEADAQTVQSGGLQGPFHAHFRSPCAGMGYPSVPQRPQRARSLVGAALLFRRRAFVDLGGYDDAFCPILFEDTDMLWRLARCGAEIVWVPRSRIVHLGGASLGRDPGVTHDNRLRWQTSHGVRSILTNAPWFSLLGELGFLAAVTLAYHGLEGLRSLFDAARWNFARGRDTISRRKRFRTLAAVWKHTLPAEAAG